MDNRIHFISYQEIDNESHQTQLENGDDEVVSVNENRNLRIKFRTIGFTQKHLFTSRQNKYLLIRFLFPCNLKSLSFREW